MVFPVVMFKWDRWTIKNVEHQRIDSFELWFGEDSWESLGLQGDPISQSSRKSVQIFTGRTDAEAETPILWPPDAKNWLVGKDWGWDKLKAGGEEDNRVWDGWMASPTQCTWVWASSGNWWWTGKPGVLHSMGSQRVGHNWVTELNWYVHTDKCAFTHMCACVCTYTNKLLYPLFFYTNIL